MQNIIITQGKSPVTSLIEEEENLVVGLRMEKVLETNPRENLVVGLRKELLEVLMQNQKKDFMQLKRKQKNNLFFISVN